MRQREVALRVGTRRPKIPRDRTLRFALDVMGELGVEGSVAVEVCGRARMAALNARYRRKRGPTDVLAFPDGESDGTGRVHLGDLLICAAVVARNGRERGHGFAGEFYRVLLHGLLHLAGYDHETDQGRMARREKALARRWGLPA